MAVLPPALRDSVVVIGLPGDPETQWVATGFFYGRLLSEKGDQGLYCTYLVTNRHVMVDKSRIVIRCNPKAHEDAHEFRIDLLNDAGSAKWLAHPDSEIDVAALPFDFGELVNLGMEVEHFRSNSAAWTTEQMKQGMVTEGDAVFVIGFPMGLIGPTRNCALVRGGTIASIRGLLEGDADEFLVDSFVFPGNSGGPVILRPELSCISGTKPHSKAVLLGIVRAYIPYKEPAVSPQTGLTRIVFMENSGLASVHPVDCIEQTIAPHIAAMPPIPPEIEAALQEKKEREE